MIVYLLAHSIKSVNLKISAAVAEVCRVVHNAKIQIVEPPIVEDIDSENFFDYVLVDKAELGELDIECMGKAEL